LINKQNRIIYFSKQIHTTLNQTSRKTHFEDQVWINDDQRKQTNGRRSAPLAQHHQELQRSKQPTYHHARNGQQRNFDVTPNKQYRTFV